MTPLPFRLAGPLLEWAPLVIVSENALEEVLQWGIKIDVVLAADRRVEMVKPGLSVQAPVKILSYRTGESPMMKALSFLLSSKQTAVNIITSVSEEVFVPAEVFMHQLQVNLFDEKLKWSAISTGNFEKWLSVRTKLRIRKSFVTQSVQSQGLIEYKDCFESTADGIINIRSDQSFWVAQQYV